MLLVEPMVEKMADLSVANWAALLVEQRAVHLVENLVVLSVGARVDYLAES